MREIALHLLDIAENSVAAQARAVSITIDEDLAADRLKASICDDGHGMDPEMVARITDPFVTSRTTRKVGLGIPLLKAAAEACQGGMRIESQVGQGTRMDVEFQRSHIDRMPLGDLAGTLLTLVVAYPDLNWKLDYRALAPGDNSRAEFNFDDLEIKEILGEIPLTEPDVLAFIRGHIEEGVAEVQKFIADKENSYANREITR